MTFATELLRVHKAKALVAVEPFVTHMVPAVAVGLHIVSTIDTEGFSFTIPVQLWIVWVSLAPLAAFCDPLVVVINCLRFSVNSSLEAANSHLFTIPEGPVFTARIST